MSCRVSPVVFASKTMKAFAIVGVDETIGAERVAVEECGAMAGGFGRRRPVGPGQGGGGVGLFSGQQVERFVIAALREVTLDEAMDRAGNLTEQPGDVVVPRRRQRMKLHGDVGAGGEDAVGRRGMAASMFAAAERQVPCHLAARPISVAWSAISDAGVRRLDVRRTDVRIADKETTASRSSCANVQRERSAVNSGHPRGSSPRATSLSGGQAAASLPRSRPYSGPDFSVTP